MHNPSIIQYFFQADWVVKFIMLLLLSASILSWTFIFQRIAYLRQTKAELKGFEQKLNRVKDLNILYAGLDNQRRFLHGISYIFYCAFKSFLELRSEHNHIESDLDSVRTTMQIEAANARLQLEKHLSFLGTVASISPYIGLLGTVWGIMNAFQALGQVQQASIAMVAPGISEALLATAMGLFAAIPAAIAYNRLIAEIDNIETRYNNFQEKFLTLFKTQFKPS